jgi:hypothetical protein
MRRWLKSVGALVCSFLFVGLIILFGLFYAIRYTHIQELKLVPPPPLVISEYPQIGMTNEGFVGFGYMYETELSLINTIRYYEDDVTRQGWNAQVAYEGSVTCFLLGQDSSRLYVQIQKDAIEYVRVGVFSQNASAICTRDRVWNHR